MSRIAGTRNLRDSKTAAKMLDALGAQGVSVRELAGVSFGATSASAMAASPTTIVALDGHLYGEPEGGAATVRDLYEKMGFERTLQELNGDFSIALFDAKTGDLYLARDRFGLRPLFYFLQSGELYFASRLRSLLAVDGASREPDHRFVACFAGSHYRTFDNEPSRSPYAGIAQVPAAHYVRVRLNGTTEVVRYWGLRDEGDTDVPEEELAERYRDLLLDAVRIRLRAHARPLFTLSGGMDSSSVLGSAVRATGQKQLAYSTVYDDVTYDESDEIRSMLDSTVSRWTPVRIGLPDLASVIPRMVEANDEPVATATWLSHYLMCEAVARDGGGSLFGGLGGDELNAGEYEYFFFFFADLRAAGREDVLRHETEQWVHYHDHPVFRKSPAVMEDGLRRLVDMSIPGKCLPDRKRLARYADTVRPEYFDLGSYEPTMDHPFSSYLKNRTYQDIYRETAPCCLRAADRQCAAFGLDVVWPFFDHRLVELMFRVPSSLKIRSGVTKHLLRLAMRGVLPEETRTRVKKTGWNAPAHVWFAGKGGEFVRDLVSSKAFRERGIYVPRRVTEILDEHQRIVGEGRNEDNHMMFLWQLVNLEIWLSHSRAPAAGR